MLKLKKTAVAVLALGSSAVFAGTMGPVCVPGNVTIPCEKTAWGIGAQALYLEPSYTSDFGYRNRVQTAGVGSQYEYLDPKWGWGFQIEGSYQFNTGNDLNLNWYHFNHGKSGFWTAGGSQIDNFYINPQWDAVNFEVGQHVDFSDMKSMRLHAGVEYARIRHNIQTVQDPVREIVSDTFTYNGFGPRMGADLRYDVGNGFGIFANGAAGLLIGTSKAGAIGATGVNAVTFNNSGSRTQMVPELEGKLGAKYNYAMAQGDLGLDVGYMWINYFNTTIEPVTSDSSNFALNGIFFGATWVGNVM